MRAVNPDYEPVRHHWRRKKGRSVAGPFRLTRRQREQQEAIVAAEKKRRVEVYRRQVEEQRRAGVRKDDLRLDYTAPDSVGRR